MREIELNDVVQIDLSHKWAGVLITVTEVNDWGIQGFNQSPLKGPCYIRLSHDEYELVGKSPLTLKEL